MALFGRKDNTDIKDKSAKIKLEKRTRIVIHHWEMDPELSSVKDNVVAWLGNNKFEAAPEYGDNYFIHKSYKAGTLGLQYQITDENDLIMYCHYHKPEFAQPLNINDPSMKSMAHYGRWLEQIFMYLKGRDRFNSKDVSVYFAKEK